MSNGVLCRTSGNWLWRPVAGYRSPLVHNFAIEYRQLIVAPRSPSPTPFVSLRSIQRGSFQSWLSVPSQGRHGISNLWTSRPPFVASIPGTTTIISLLVTQKGAWSASSRRLYSTDRKPAQYPERENILYPGDHKSNIGKDGKTSDSAVQESTAQHKFPMAATGSESIAASVSKYFHLPQMRHRPTREELLAAATGFWSRMKVRFKWASIRSMRPWNIDEWGAFVSWFLFGHLVWILVGTTTFFSLLIFFINTVLAQETLAKWVGDYLTQSAGITVVFESAIVPRWRDGVIAFRNVFVSRRPGQVESFVSKGAYDVAAAAAALEARDGSDVTDDGNYTQFDMNIANIDVTLSFLNWWNGKGFLKDVEVKGVRGVVDRTFVRWSTEQIEPFSYRHKHKPGDFEIESFKLEDLLLTIHQPGGFRPFSVSIYSCELPQLRKQWLFYDVLSANHMSGSFDGSLFTIHPRQLHGIASAQDQSAMLAIGEPHAWKKFSRLRIDGLKIDHLNRGVRGTFGWIYEGNVDIVADIAFPAESDESLTKVMADFYDQLEEAVISNRYRLLDQKKESHKDPVLRDSGHLSEASALGSDGSLEPQSEVEPRPRDHDHHDHQQQQQLITSEDGRRYLIMDLRIHLNSVKAAVPIFTREISYVNQALVRPIVAYINAKNTYIPMTCRIVKRTSDFDGSWTVFDCGLMDDMSAETYEAFARDVEDQRSRVRRFRKVGFWTLSLAVHALFMGMAGNVV